VVVDRGVGAGPDRVGVGGLKESRGLIGDRDVAERGGEVVEVDRLAVVGASAGRFDRASIVDGERAGRGRAECRRRNPDRISQALDGPTRIVGEFKGTDVGQIGGVEIDATRDGGLDHPVVLDVNVTGAGPDGVGRGRADDSRRRIVNLDVGGRGGDGLEVQGLPTRRSHGAGIVERDGAVAEVGIDAPGVIAGRRDGCTGIVVDGDAAGRKRAGSVDGAGRRVDRAGIVDDDARGVRPAGPGDRCRRRQRASRLDRTDIVGVNGFWRGVSDARIDSETSHGLLHVKTSSDEGDDAFTLPIERATRGRDRRPAHLCGLV